jgi:folate-binding protein YgfZ
MSDIPFSSIFVSGPDSFDFLQAQLTVDLQSLAKNTAVRSAWSNPKGRVICMPYLTENTDGYCLAIPTELVDLVIQRMTMFRFRSKVDFEARIATQKELGIETTVDDWLLENLRAGIPEIWLSQSEKFTPHMLNLDMLDIVSLDKGCYPGQEIVARTHFRGTSKRRCLRFESTDPLSPGDKVSDGQRDIGEVVNAIGNDLLAVVPIEKKDAALEVNGVTLQYIALPYVG